MKNKKRLARRRGKKHTNPVVFVVLIIVAVIQLFPLYWMITFSLKSNAEIFITNPLGLPKEWQWDNYLTVFSKGNMGTYLMNSIIVTAATIVVTLLLASMATYAIVRMKWRLSKAVYTIFLVGMMLSVHAVLLPLFINLHPILDTYFVLILPYTAFALPIAVLLMVGTLEGLPKEMEEAAFIDGANVYRLFFQVILPLLAPILSTVAILTFISSWNELMLSITFISTESHKTITVGVNDLIGKYHTKWGLVGAGLSVATMPTLVMFALLSKNIQKSLALGAVKG